MPHNCCRNIVTTFSGVCQPLKKIALFASDQLLSGPPQRRVEGAVSLDRRTPQCHVAAAGNTSFRKRADLSPQVDRIGYRTFGITRHPGRASRRIFGYDRASGRCSVGVGVEEGDVRRDELFVDAFVVVDDGDVFAPAFVDTPVAGMGEPLPGFGYDPKVDCGMFCCERFEPGQRVILRIVVHDDALPLCGREILPHDRPERFDERCGAVVSGDDER